MRKKVLLVDDSVTIHKIVDLTLDRKYFELISAYNVEDGITAILNEKPAAMLIDSELFKDAGEDKILRIKKSSPNMGIILLIGAYDQFVESDLEYPLIDEFLVKPFNSNTLNAVLIDIIDKKGDPGAASQDAETVAIKTVPLLIETPEEKTDAPEIAKEDLMPQDEQLTDMEPDIIEIESEISAAAEPVIEEPEVYAVTEFAEEELPVSGISLEENADAIPLFDEESLSMMGINLEELMKDDEPAAPDSEEPGEISDSGYFETDESTPDESAPEEPVMEEPAEEETGIEDEAALADEIPLNESPSNVLNFDEIFGDDTEDMAEYAPTESVSIDDIEIFDNVAEAGADNEYTPEAASPMAEMLDIIDEAMEVQNEEPIDLNQMNELIDDLDVDPLASDMLNIKVEDILEPDKYDFISDDASFNNVESAMHDDSMTTEHSYHENAPEDPGVTAEMDDAFSADEPDLFVNVPMFEEPDTGLYEQNYSDAADAELEERKELMSLFDELHLNFDGAHETTEAEAAPYAHVETPPAEAKAAPADDGKKVDLIPGGAGEISPKTKEPGAKLVIELPKEELTQLLAHAINKEMLEKIIKEVLKESIGESVEKLVPQIAESLVREELRLIKGE